MHDLGSLLLIVLQADSHSGVEYVKLTTVHLSKNNQLDTIRPYLLLKLTHYETAGESNLVLTRGSRAVVEETGSET